VLVQSLEPNGLFQWDSMCWSAAEGWWELPSSTEGRMPKNLLDSLKYLTPCLGAVSPGVPVACVCESGCLCSLQDEQLKMLVRHYGQNDWKFLASHFPVSNPLPSWELLCLHVASCAHCAGSPCLGSSLHSGTRFCDCRGWLWNSAPSRQGSIVLV